jgi:hypothetical protein
MPLELLRHAPTLIARLVRTTFGIDLGEHVSFEETKASFQDARLSVYHADLVLKGKEAASVVELQLSIDEDKLVRWPHYTASVHSIFRKKTWLVVIAFDSKVAEWAGHSIETFHRGFTPLVLGPSDIPRITDLEEARREPELAVLSAMAHGESIGGEEVAFAALTGANELAHEDENRAKLLADMVFCVVSENAREILEAMMKAHGYEYQSDFARKYVAQGREEGREEGRAEGLEEGLAKGLAAVRTTLRTMCGVLDLGWSAEREEQIAHLGLPELEALATRLARERRWPL